MLNKLQYQQESRAVARKPRDAAAVLFGLKFAEGRLKMQDLKMQDLKMTDQFTGPENAGPENDGPILLQNTGPEIFRPCDFLGPSFSGRAFSGPVNWSVIFRSCIFSAPFADDIRYKFKSSQASKARHRHKTEFKAKWRFKVIQSHVFWSQRKGDKALSNTI